MAGIVSEIRTPFRRPCLMRMMTEADVDASPRRGSPEVHEGYPFSRVSGGSGILDDRVLTIDHEARMSPRSSGLHKGRVNSPPEPTQQAKSESIRTLQAFGIHGNSSDLNLIETKRHLSESPISPRPKVEALQDGRPLSGRGADIALACGRRIQGLEGRDQPCSPRDAKRNLNEVSIEHQFQRRHKSAPPISDECKRKDDFEHTLSAEGYSHLLNRPEGIMRNASHRPKTVRSLTVRPTRSVRSNELKDHPSPRTPHKEGFRELRLGSRIHEEPDPEGDVAAGRFIPEEAASVPAQSAQLIAALRDATRNTPAEAVWDAMLNAIAESPQLFSPKATNRGMANAEVPSLSLPAKVAAAVQVAANGGLPSSPHQKTRNTPPEKKVDSPRHGSPRRRGRMSRDASDTSVLSSTTADTMSGVFSQPGLVSSQSVTQFTGSQSEWSTGSQSHTSSGASLPPSAHNGYPGSAHNMRKTMPSRRTCITAGWLREEQYKARRRAQWVA